jgi:hypothetical protein
MNRSGANSRSVKKLQLGNALQKKSATVLDVMKMHIEKSNKKYNVSTKNKSVKMKHKLPILKRRKRNTTKKIMLGGKAM